jgi:hypothetical protein
VCRRPLRLLCLFSLPSNIHSGGIRGEVPSSRRRRVDHFVKTVPLGFLISFVCLFSFLATHTSLLLVHPGASARPLRFGFFVSSLHTLFFCIFTSWGSKWSITGRLQRLPASPHHRQLPAGCPVSQEEEGRYPAHHGSLLPTVAGVLHGETGVETPIFTSNRRTRLLDTSVTPSPPSQSSHLESSLLALRNGLESWRRRSLS